MDAYSLVTYVDFTYKNKFTELTEDEFTEAKDIVKAMWYGVTQLWAVCEEEVRNQKRSAVLNLLIAWYLADVYPTRLTGGMQTSGGMPITRKRIRDVDISYASLNLPQAYDALGSNQFGVKAANLIRYAPEMMGIYG
jgi:hypothetical protein